MQIAMKRFDELTTLELYELLQLRVSVFVVEQNCPYLEIDGKDPFSYHVIMKDKDGIKAYLRIITPQSKNDHLSIGRVIATERGKGLGKTIMLAAMKAAKEKLAATEIHIEAQTYAKEFYEKLGFKQISDEFLEDGIPHIKMIAIL